MYCLSQYIFTRELAVNPAFDVNYHVCTGFFEQVFTLLNGRDRTLLGPRSLPNNNNNEDDEDDEPYLRTPQRRTPADCQVWRDIIRKYLADYLLVAGYNQPYAYYLSNTAQYEGQEACTAYFVATKNGLGKRPMQAMRYLSASDSIAAIRARIEGLRRTRAEKDGMIQRTITDQIAELHKQTETGQIVRHKISSIYPVFRPLIDIIRRYAHRQFDDDNIYYDIKSNPHKHVYTYIAISTLFETLGQKGYHCYPRRRYNVPPHVLIDNIGISAKSYFRRKPTNAENKDRPKPKRKKKKSTAKKPPEFRYVHELSEEEHQEIRGKCVFVDPGRRDLLYCMHESSTLDSKCVYRYTSNMRRRWTGMDKYAKIRQRVRAERKDVLDMERELSLAPSNTSNLDDFDKFLRAQARARPALSDFYSNTMTNGPNPLPLHRKLRLNAHFGQQKADKLLCEDLRNKFGKDAVLIVGNWGARNQKHHAPIRGIGVLRMLRDNGFRVFLINEFRTSSICPACETERLQNPQAR
ncbi:hypothetical protein EV175_001770, partial [Coemansia sp. RSA 1933]